MSTTVYADRIILKSNLGVITIPTGDLKTFQFSVAGNINFAQGNTIDNSSSGFVAGNREPTFSFSAMIRKGSEFQEYLISLAQNVQTLSISGMVATAGIGYQLNPVTRFTLITAVFSDESYNFAGIAQEAMQDFSGKALDLQMS